MERVDRYLVFLFFTAFFLSLGSEAFAQTKETEKPPTVRDEFFLVQGTVTEVRPGEKLLHVKIDAGLEITFYENESTLIHFGAKKQSLADLAAGDTVEIKYIYDEGYRKMAQAIFVKGHASEPELTAEKA